MPAFRQKYVPPSSLQWTNGRDSMNIVNRLSRFGQKLIPGPRNRAAESLRKYRGTPTNSDKFIHNIVASRDTRFIQALVRDQGYSSTNIVKHNQRIRDKDRRDFLGVI